MESKLRGLHELTNTIDRIKSNQDHNTKRIKDVDEKLVKFKDSVKNKIDVKIDKSLKVLETTVSNLIMMNESGRNSKHKYSPNPGYSNPKSPQEFNGDRNVNRANDQNNYPGTDPDTNIPGGVMNEGQLILDQFNQEAGYNITNIYGANIAAPFPKEEVIAEVERG